MKRIIPILLIACIMIFGSDLFAQQIYSPERILVLFDSESNTEKQEVRDKVCKGHIETIPGFNLELWSFSPNIEIEGKCFVEIEDYLSFLQKRYPTLYVQPDYAYRLLTAPNDPDYGLQWSLNNEGNNSCPNGIDLGIEAVSISTRTAPNITVGIIDTGIDWTHPDLIHNIWQNLGEDFDGDGKVLEWNGNRWIFDPGDENGFDDDGNGFDDDFIGWNFAYNNNNPDDDAGHGTHVAGIIGAEGNNGIGISGIAWEIQLMGLKFMDSTGTGYTSTAIKALKYAKDMGAPISNNSWGGAPRDQLLYLAIEEAGLEGHLFVAAAGNNDQNNNDLLPVYPTSYDLDNIISVGAHDCKADISFYSNIGPRSVDLFAPGGGQLNAIYSTVPGGYAYKNGTSMAAPHVTGVAALLKEKIPTYGYRKLKDRILSTVIGEGSMTGKCLAQGRLSAAAALLKESEKDNGQQEIDYFPAIDWILDITSKGDTLYLGAYMLGLGIYNRADSTFNALGSSNSIVRDNLVGSVARDSSGNIWAGSRVEGGIYRYDGKTFTNYTEANGYTISFINTIEVDSSGNIWFAGRNNHLFKFDGLNTWQVYEDSLTTNAIAFGANEMVWLGKDTGLKRLEKDSSAFDWVYDTSNVDTGMNLILDLLYSSDGKLWIASRRDFVSVLQGDSIFSYKDVTLTSASKLAEDRDGNIWISSPGPQGIYQFDGSNFISHGQGSGLANNRVYALHVDESGTLWAGGRRELYTYNSAQSPPWQKVELGKFQVPGGRIRKMAIDNEGNLWVASWLGLGKKLKNSWKMFSLETEPSLKGDRVNSITIDDDNNIWIYDNIYDIVRIKDDSIVDKWDINSLTNMGFGFRDIEIGDSPFLWLATNKGLIKFDYSQPADSCIIGINCQLFDSATFNTTSSYINVIEPESDSILWLGTTTGELVKFNTKTDSAETSFALFDIPANIWNISIDSSGGVWASMGAGIFRFQNDSITHFTSDDFILSDAYALGSTVDYKGNIWFGTWKGGLLRYNPSDSLWTSWTSDDVNLPVFAANPNDPDPVFTNLIVTPDNHIWIGTENNGIFEFIPDAAASFTITKSTLCIGEVLTFINQTKRADSFIWAINDSIVSRDSNYTQNFWEAGEFKVTLTAIDSVLGDRSFTRFITVKAPIQVDLGADTVLCSPVILLKAPQDGESYFWSNLRGDTISTRRIITSDTSGTYILKAIDACGAVAADTISVTFTGRDCIWPGDVNRDGFVNLIDFLHLGLAHGEIGPSRDSLGIVWKGYEGLAWQDSSGGIDHKFYDCDGNGLVDIQTDFFAIRENYNHPIASFPVHNADAYFYFRPVNRTFNFGDTILFDFFLGSQGAPLTDVYGVSWSLKLNIFPSQEPVYDKSGSEMGNSSQVKAAIALRDRASRRLEMAITLLDGTGFNPLGDFKLMSAGPIVIIDDIEDPFALGRNRFLTVSVEEVVLFDKEGNSIPVAALSSQATHTLQLAVPQTQLDLSAWLEGASDSDSMRTDLQEQGILSPIPPLAAFENYSKDSLPDGAVDWIIVELLREQDMTIAYTKALLLMSDGSMYDPIAKDTLAHFLAVEGNYYLRIQHRNHLDVISSEALHLSEQVSTYDFSEASSRAMGFEPMKLLANGKYGLMAGDGNGDDGIYISDKREVWKVQFGLTGYRAADYNLDGIVDDRDLIDFWRKNLLLTTKTN